MNRVTLSFAVCMAASLSQAATAAAPIVAPSAETVRVAKNTEIPVEKDAPALEGHPVTSVVVTQCNLIVAVYVTMPDGRLLRFDHNATVPAGELLQMAYSATRSERVEVACDETEGAVAGAVGFEKHEPI